MNGEGAEYVFRFIDDSRQPSTGAPESPEAPARRSAPQVSETLDRQRAARDEARESRRPVASQSSSPRPPRIERKLVDLPEPKPQSAKWQEAIEMARSLAGAIPGRMGSEMSRVIALANRSVEVAQKAAELLGKDTQQPMLGGKTPGGSQTTQSFLSQFAETISRRFLGKPGPRPIIKAELVGKAVEPINPSIADVMRRGGILKRVEPVPTNPYLKELMEREGVVKPAVPAPTVAAKAAEKAMPVAEPITKAATTAVSAAAPAAAEGATAAPAVAGGIGAAAPALAAVAPVAIPIAIAAAGVAATAVAAKFSRDVLLDRSRRYATMSPEVASASAMNEVAQTLQDIRLGREFGGNIANFARATGKLERALDEIGTRFAAGMEPSISGLVGTLTDLVETLQPIAQPAGFAGGAILGGAVDAAVLGLGGTPAKAAWDFFKAKNILFPQKPKEDATSLFGILENAKHIMPSGWEGVSEQAAGGQFNWGAGVPGIALP